MQHKPHMDHFVGAARTLRARPVLFWIAPLASLAGIGANIDNLLYGLSFLFAAHRIAPTFTASLTNLLPPSVIGPTLNLLARNTPLLIVTIVVILVALWFQGVLLHVAYVHGKHRKHASVGTAFRHAARNLWRSLIIHATAISAVFLLLLELDWALSAITVPGAVWVQAPIIVLGSLLILLVLTGKMLALQRVFGADETLTQAVQDAWSMVTRSPIAVLEFNLLLFVINIVGYIMLLALLTLLAVLITAIVTLIMMAGGSALASTFLAYALSLVAILGLSGCLTAFNMAAWSHLTKTLETRRVGSALRHLTHRYLS